MINFSDYERTGNNAIDLVGEAVGWARKMKKPIKSVTLKPSQYALFWAGIEILRKEPLPEEHHLTFEGVDILKGPMGQFDSLTIQYHELKPLAIA